jgi:hypothetical protein
MPTNSSINKYHKALLDSILVDYNLLLHNTYKSAQNIILLAKYLTINKNVLQQIIIYSVNAAEPCLNILAREQQPTVGMPTQF